MAYRLILTASVLRGGTTNRMIGEREAGRPLAGIRPIVEADTWIQWLHKGGPKDVDLRSSERAFQFRALMENTEDSIYFKDRECRLLRVSRRMADSLGFSDVSGARRQDRHRPVRRVVRPADVHGRPPDHGVERADHRAGRDRPVGRSETNWTLTTKVPLHDASGAVVGLLGITREINELKRTELNLQHLATHDPLTGLPNRYLMTDRLSQTLAQSERTGSIFAVLFLDVDDFKSINDARGHEFGDLVLRALGETLVSTVRASDTVARIGGDEFVIILETLGRREDASLVADKILRSVAQAVHAQAAQGEDDRQHRDQRPSRQRQRRRGPAPGGRLRDVPGQGPGQEPLAGLPPGPAWLEQGRPRR